MCLYCNASCRVLRWLRFFFPCLHCLFLRGSVWGTHSPPAGPLLQYWYDSDNKSLRASAAAPPFSPAPLSLPLPLSLSPRWRSPPRRPRPSSTDCVRTTASGPSGASPSATCPGRSIKEKKNRATDDVTEELTAQRGGLKMLLRPKTCE